MCAGLRAIYLAIYIFIDSYTKTEYSDVIIADQITFHLPILKLSAKKVLFYCHFPDKYLAPKSDGLLRSGTYRRLLDWAEEQCLAVAADEIVVNSLFTQNKFKEAFKSITKLPEVLYPGTTTTQTRTQITASLCSNESIFLSLNRFERKKDLHLAIESFNLCKSENIKLIIAGGYDQRVKENCEHLIELQDICTELNLSHKTLFQKDYKKGKESESEPRRISDIFDLKECQVLFLPSISQEIKTILLQNCIGMLYTPSFEHFGIVPIEAMNQGLPVIAMNSGGPKETIVNNVTGFLCESDAIEISDAMDKLVNMKQTDLSNFKLAGKMRVQQMFSLKVFGDRLDHIIKSMTVFSKKLQ